MKQLKEGLINKKNITDIDTFDNKFGVSENDLIGEIKDLPLEILVYALEEMEYQTGKADLTMLQKHGILNSINWTESRDGRWLWSKIYHGNYDEFFREHPKKRAKK